MAKPTKSHERQQTGRSAIVFAEEEFGPWLPTEFLVKTCVQTGPSHVILMVLSCSDSLFIRTVNCPNLGSVT